MPDDRATSPSRLRPRRSTEESLDLCLYCASLCRHVCPVANAEGRDTVSAWGLQSLTAQIRQGRVEPTKAMVETLLACNACGACTDACAHEVEVFRSLTDSRAELFRLRPELFPEPSAPPPLLDLDALSARARYLEYPSLCLLPGPYTDTHTLNTLLDICDALELDQLALGRLSSYDLGYEAWLLGDHETFKARAQAVVEASQDATELVCMSAETLFLLRDIYPEFGFHLNAELVHISEMLFPVVSGAELQRLPGRYAYHECSHTRFHLALLGAPQQVLNRALKDKLVALPPSSRTAGSCGGSGRRHGRVATTEAMADQIIAELALEEIDHLLTFSPECTVALSAAQARAEARGLPTPQIKDAYHLLAEALEKVPSP